MLILANKKFFLKESCLFSFVIYQNKTYYYFTSFKPIAINFLYINIGFSNTNTRFLYKTWLYYLDLITRIDKNFYKVLVKVS